MKIGTVDIPTQIALAPMAGVTDLAFRTVCRELSGCYTISEMVSAKALCYGDKKTASLLKLGPEEHPAAVQIFGSDEACMEKGAALALERSGADILDVNMGCPVPKVVNAGDGSALMRDPDKAVRVIRAVIRGAAGVPVTVKFRLGWDKGSINCVDFARRMEDAGVAAVAVHGRTRTQMYSGTANWDYIREVKQAVSIPVIANGDVFAGKDAARILRYTGADMAMVGRGVFGQAEALPEGDGQTVQAVELGVHRIEAVAEGGEGHRPLPVAEGHEAEIQDVVGAVGEKHVLRGQAEVVRQLPL